MKPTVDIELIADIALTVDIELTAVMAMVSVPLMVPQWQERHSWERQYPDTQAHLAM